MGKTSALKFISARRVSWTGHGNLSQVFCRLPFVFCRSSFPVCFCYCLCRLFLFSFIAILLGFTCSWNRLRISLQFSTLFDNPFVITFVFCACISRPTFDVSSLRMDIICVSSVLLLAIMSGSYANRSLVGH